ncbi:MAG TPA: serine/threonine protein kinase [Bdellovibrionales bacterium]|nr:serine/threonine protein kinase [Bdellovibrionales bacterium]
MSDRTDGFYSLTPHVVLEALEDAGFRSNGYVTALNSYENRVMSVGLEETGEYDEQLAGSKAVVAKFYRPGRWSFEAIKDEHDFLWELKAEGIPAVAPLKFQDGETIRERDGIFYSVFPKVLGRSPQEFVGDELKQVGRRLAQIHNIGARREAEHRLSLTAHDFGWPALDVLESWVTPELWPRYEQASETIVDFITDRLDPADFIRIHGDCHKGNLLHNGREFFFVDFDDFMNGPPVQDFWMLFSGDPEDAEREREQILSGYEELRDLDERTLGCMEALRGLRIMHYAAWIARRWEDPSFPRLFPHFNSYLYWLEETDRLERIANGL